jgi:hypothetical protein
LAHSKPPVPRPGNKPDSGLAGAFKSSIGKAEDDAALLEMSSADEWYAAINGVPVGPVRIGELRRKAALGAVTEDSLVWQEGMEEWRPVKTVPDLAALVREAASGKVAMLTPESPTTRGSVLPPAPAPQAPSMRPGPARPLAPAPRGASERPAARSNVVPFASRAATAERLDEPATAGLPAPMSERFSISDPFNVPAAAAAPPAPALTPPSAAVAVAAPPAPAAPSMQAPVIVQMPRQPNYIAIGMILMMVTFGGVGAYVFFQKPAPPAPPATVNTVYVPAPVTAAAPTAEAVAPADSSPGKVARNSTGPKPAASSSSKPALDLKGLGPGAAGVSGAAGGVDLSGLGGGPGAAGAGGGSLTSDQIMSVLNSHKVAIKRTCVERGGQLVGTANEKLQVTIDGNGQVTSAQADGNNSAIGACLEKEVKAWRFPPTGATTKTEMPFVFVAQ